jgi:hypothetical protein
MFSIPFAALATYNSGGRARGKEDAYVEMPAMLEGLFAGREFLRALWAFSASVAATANGAAEACFAAAALGGDFGMLFLFQGSVEG